jgi:hypothetical protein
MVIILGIYLLFLLAYIIFNTYAVYRVLSMKMVNDSTTVIAVIYILVITIIIIVSILLISLLDWSQGFGNII